jgi:hypothetical protein
MPSHRNTNTNNNKYVRNVNGSLLHNVITHEPILKSLAIEIPTVTGHVRTYDAVALHNWFIKLDKKELRGFISHLTPTQRARIMKLNAVYEKLQAEKVALQLKHKVKGTRLVNNAALVGIRALEFAMSLLVFLSIYFIFILSCLYKYSFSPEFLENNPSSAINRPAFLGGFLGGASFFIGTSFGSIRMMTKVNRAFVKSRLTMLKRQLERHIDGIPFRGSDIRTIEYLLDTARFPFMRRRRSANSNANIARVSNQMRALGVL